jgi:hypothetical protein
MNLRKSPNPVESLAVWLQVSELELELVEQFVLASTLEYQLCLVWPAVLVRGHRRDSHSPLDEAAEVAGLGLVAEKLIFRFWPSPERC